MGVQFSLGTELGWPPAVPTAPLQLLPMRARLLPVPETVAGVPRRVVAAATAAAVAPTPQLPPYRARAGASAVPEAPFAICRLHAVYPQPAACHYPPDRSAQPLKPQATSLSETPLTHQVVHGENCVCTYAAPAGHLSSLSSRPYRSRSGQEGRYTPRDIL